LSEILFRQAEGKEFFVNILVCNVGSTSLKYQLFDMDGHERVLATGKAERVGSAQSVFSHAAAMEAKRRSSPPHAPRGDRPYAQKAS
jgi:acetate kinase